VSVGSDWHGRRHPAVHNSTHEVAIDIVLWPPARQHLPEQVRHAVYGLVEYGQHFELTMLVCCRLDLPVYSSKEELGETLHLVRGTLSHPMTCCERMTDVMALFVSAGHSNGRHGLQQSLGH
jgi:hypothetical protein